MKLRVHRSLAPVALAFALVTAGCGDDDGSDVATADGVGADGGGDELPYAGYERTPAPEVGELTLPAVESDGSTTEFAFRADDGGLLLVYFGYTSCPDVCPTTLSDVRLALGDLGGDADRVDLAMVTIDPEVDTAEVLTGYVRSFVPEASAVRTDDDPELREVATAFGADYGVEDPDGAHEVYHTGSLYAVDSSGQLVLTWPFGVAADDLGADVRRLLDGAAG